MPAARKPSPSDHVTINRAPVLTLWAAVVAERLGHDPDEAATLGKALAGMNAASKARTLGLTKPATADAAATAGRRLVKPAEHQRVELMGRLIPVTRTPKGVRATADGKPVSAESVQRYLGSKFGDSLGPVRDAMQALAASLPKPALAERAFALYEKFRPAIPAGVAGWGAKGVLDLALVRSLARSVKRA